MWGGGGARQLLLLQMCINTNIHICIYKNVCVHLSGGRIGVVGVEKEEGGRGAHLEHRVRAVRHRDARPAVSQVLHVERLHLLEGGAG